MRSSNIVISHVNRKVQVIDDLERTVYNDHISIILNNAKLFHVVVADCEDILMDTISTSQHAIEGAYLIKPDGSTQSAQTYCSRDIEGRVWTRIQARFDGSVDFARSWEDYRLGFGLSGDRSRSSRSRIGGEFWIGNMNLHYLTTQDTYSLQIDMWDLDDVYRYARYDTFRVGSEGEQFSLQVREYSGNATDALRYSDAMEFSTSDVDNDVSSTHCAKFYTAGWWYKHCHYSNLNGRYTVGVVWFNQDVDQWLQMKRTVMSISRRYEEPFMGTNNPEVVTSMKVMD